MLTCWGDGMSWSLRSLPPQTILWFYAFFNSLWEVTHLRDSLWDCCAEGFFLRLQDTLVWEWCLERTLFSPVSFGWMLRFFLHGHWGRKGSDPGGTALYPTLFGNESSTSWIKKSQFYAHKDIGVMSGHHSIRVTAFEKFLPQIHCANLCWCWVCERWGGKQSSKEPCECGNTLKKWLVVLHPFWWIPY